MLNRGFDLRISSHSGRVSRTLNFKKKMADSVSKWNFDLHCTKQIPKSLAQSDFGYDSNEFAFASNFQILTPEAVKISLDLIKNNQTIKDNCRFNDNSINNRLKQSPNTFAYRNISGINPWFRDMLSCKKLEKYLQDITGDKHLQLETNSWTAGHVNVQEAREESDSTPNIAWHNDTAHYAMLIVLNDMPENPVGGETLTRKKSGEIVSMKYQKQGDSAFIRGSVIEHCGMPGKNFNKVLLAAGVGSSRLDRVVRSPIRSYHLGHSDIVDFARQFTEYRVNRFQKQIEACKSGDDERRSDVLATMSAEFEIFRTSYAVFLDHCQTGDLKVFGDGVWLKKD